MRFFGRNLVTLLLIAVMALSAVSSPALRHSHTDGDQSHQHSVATVEHRQDAHACDHKHSTRHHRHADATRTKKPHDERASQSAQSPVVHLHVFGFGFQSSLPLSDPDRSDSRPSNPGAEEWVPLISEISFPNVAQDGSTILAVDLLTPTGLMPRLPARSEVRPPRESAMALLCDAARRERSGVLVI